MAPKDEEGQYKKARLFGSFDEFITLIAGEGEGQTRFAVHKKVLCGASPFFKAACKSEWMKPEDMAIKMPEDYPEAIHVMVYWMYHHEICVTNTILRCEGGASSQLALDSAWGLFAKLYVLGQKYQMQSLQNDAIDAIDAILHLNSSYAFTPGIISWVYEQTADKGDSLRNLIFRLARTYLTTIDLNALRSDLCAEFLFDMAYAFVEDREGAGNIDDLPDNPDYDESYESYRTGGFCAKFHVTGGCMPRCRKAKKYILIPWDEV